MILNLPNYIVHMSDGGLYHRIDGPAVETDIGKWWYQNGLLHRSDGPAIMTKNIQEHWLEGRPHRTDGPARLFLDTKIAEFWISGEYIAHADFTQPNNDINVFNSYWVKEI
jgi:hypothetical protein